MNMFFIRLSLANTVVYPQSKNEPSNEKECIIHRGSPHPYRCGCQFLRNRKFNEKEQNWLSIHQVFHGVLSFPPVGSLGNLAHRRKTTYVRGAAPGPGAERPAGAPLRGGTNSAGRPCGSAHCLKSCIFAP
jgi:hypothetical protein